MYTNSPQLIFLYIISFKGYWKKDLKKNIGKKSFKGGIGVLKLKFS